MKLFKSISVYSSVSIITSGVSFLLLPILTKHLSKADYGILSLFNATTRFFGILISLGVVNILVTYLFKKDKTSLASYFKTFYILIIINCFIISFIFGISLSFFSDFFGIPKNIALFIPLIATAVIFYELIISLMIYKQQVKVYAITSLSKFAIEILLTIFFVVILLYKWEGRLLSLVLSLTCISLLGIRYLKKETLLRGAFNIKKLKKLIFLGPPLILMDLSTVILNLSDRFFIENLIGIEETGIYGIGYIVGSIVLLGLNGLINVFRPLIYEKIKIYKLESHSLLKMSVNFISILLLLTLLVTFIVNDFIFTFFIDYKFSPSKEIVFPIALGFFFWGIYSFYISYYIYLKKNNLIILFSALSIVLNLVLNYFLVLKFNIIGAAYATLITYFILGFTVYLIYVLKLKPKLLYR